MPVVTPGQVHLTSQSGVTLALPSTVTVDGIQQTWRNVRARLASGEEVPIAGPYPQPFDIFIRGVFIDPDAADARERLDELKLVLLDAPVEVRLHGASDDRYLLAYPEDLSRPNLDGLGRFGGLGLRLRVMDPYWQGDPITETKTGIIASPDFWSWTGVDQVPGNVRPDPIVTFTMTTGANLSNPRIVNTSGGQREFTVPGSFQAGDVVTVDTQRMRVYDNSGVSYLDQMGSDFLLNGWPLSVGANSLTVYATGTVRMNVAITYRPRWV